jgi:hypothetical protein
VGTWTEEKVNYINVIVPGTVLPILQKEGEKAKGQEILKTSL